MTRGRCRVPLALCGALLIAAAAPVTDTTEVLIQAGAVLDRPGEPPRGPASILVRDGKVVGIRPGYLSPEAAGMPNARLVFLRDQFVLPGLVDAHVHLTRERSATSLLDQVQKDPEDAALDGAYFAERTLQAGFTTVRDLGAPPGAIVALRDMIAAGRLAGPTIVPAGAAISGSAGHADVSGYSRLVTRALGAELTGICDGAAECRAAVRRQVQAGADVIKVTSTGGVNSNIAGGLGRQMFDDELHAVVDTAHMFGRKVAAHAHGADGIVASLKAGVDSIEHATFLDDQSIVWFRRTGAYLVPTLLASHTVNAMADRGELPPASAAKAKEAAARHRTSIANAVKAGVKIAFGTDSGVSRHGDNAKEFPLLVAAGMTPADAIRAATVVAADLLGRSGSIGSLEPGKQADVIAVRGNPLDDISLLQRVSFVMRRGVIHRTEGERVAFPR